MEKGRREHPRHLQNLDKFDDAHATYYTRGGKAMSQLKGKLRKAVNKIGNGMKKVAKEVRDDLQDSVENEIKEIQSIDELEAIYKNTKEIVTNHANETSAGIVKKLSKKLLPTLSNSLPNSITINLTETRLQQIIDASSHAKSSLIGLKISCLPDHIRLSGPVPGYDGLHFVQGVQLAHLVVNSKTMEIHFKLMDKPMVEAVGIIQDLLTRFSVIIMQGLMGRNLAEEFLRSQPSIKKENELWVVDLTKALKWTDLTHHLSTVFPEWAAPQLSKIQLQNPRHSERKLSVTAKFRFQS